MGYDENGQIIRKTIYGKTQAEAVKKLSEISGRLKVILMGQLKTIILKLFLEIKDDENK